MQNVWSCPRASTKTGAELALEIEGIALAFAEEITRNEGDRKSFVGKMLEKRLLAAARVLSILSHVHMHLKDGTFATQRSLYYNAPLLFGTQSCSNNILRTICNTLGVPRQSLHILPSASGCMAGTTDLIVELPDKSPNELHLRGSIDKPAQIPSSCSCITRMISPRGCTIFIEKETAFMSLIHIEKYLPVSLVITGKGETDSATRTLLAGAPRPIFGLVDADAYGIAILARVAGVIKQEKEIKDCPGKNETWINWRYVSDIIPIGMFIEEGTTMKLGGQRTKANKKEINLALKLQKDLIDKLSEKSKISYGWGRVLRTLEVISTTGEHYELESIPSLVEYVVGEFKKYEKEIHK